MIPEHDPSQYTADNVWTLLSMLNSGSQSLSVATNYSARILPPEDAKRVRAIIGEFWMELVALSDEMHAKFPELERPAPNYLAHGWDWEPEK